MKKDTGTLFEELLIRYTKTVEQNIRSRIKKARDKDHVKAEIRSEIALNIRWAKLDKATLAKDFLTKYKKGEDTSKIFAYTRKVFGEDVEDILPFKRIENGKKITLYISEENKALKQFALNDKKLMKFFVRYIAYLDIRKRLTELLNEEDNLPLKTKNNPDLKWTGSKDNKTEFVQLIYGLHEAGFINNGKGEITNIVKSLAEVFDLNLGNNWQTNHSKSYHKANSNYEPLIFHKIQLAYKKYTEKQIEEKNKKK